VNVGDFYGEVSSPPRKRRSVGAVIVVGAWESHVQGEGRQGIDVSEYIIPSYALVKSRAEGNGKLITAREVVNSWRAVCGESRMPGSEGGVRKRAQVTRLAPTLLK
jgi:hypothetical protein